MKMLLVIVSILFNCLPSFCQPEFAPLGAEWYYTNGEGMGSNAAGYYLLKSIKDTVIDSKECKILSRTRVSSDGITYNDGQSIVYHNTNENKVYRYLYGKFYLLYDFTKVVGDTIVIKEPYSANKYDSIVTVVDSVGIQTFSGNIQLKSFFVRPVQLGRFDFEGKIIEKLGNLHFLFPGNSLYCDSGCPDPLRCYNEDKIRFSLNQGPCDAVYSITNTSIVNTVDISVFPNPFTNSFTIKNGNQDERQLSIDIFNIYGQLILHDIIHGNRNHQINLNGYPRGFYYLVVKTKDKGITYKLIKNSYLP